MKLSRSYHKNVRLIFARFLQILKRYIPGTWKVSGGCLVSYRTKGIVYRRVKVMPYSTACNTPLSNFECAQNYEEVIDPAGNYV